MSEPEHLASGMPADVILLLNAETPAPGAALGSLTIFQGVVSCLEHSPMLRVNTSCLRRRYREEWGIEGAQVFLDEVSTSERYLTVR